LSNSIPPGVQESGVVVFEPLDKKQNAEFEFRVRKNFYENKFEFTVNNP
jgi:hypothetical protein